MEIEKQGKISFYEYLVGTFASIKNKIIWFRKYQKAYKDYFEVVNKVRTNQFPFNAILKNGKQVSIDSIDHAALFALIATNKNLEYNYDTDEIVIQNFRNNENSNKIKLHGILRNIDAILTFGNYGTYEKLPVKEKIVLDVGASIGDTSIYFALKGAKKVIGVEPFPKNFELAKRNIVENNLSNKILMLLAGVGFSEGSVTVDPNYESSMRSKLENFKNGIKIPIFSLEQIVLDYEISKGILKMDCEGCEYETILTVSQDTLQKFSHVQIEYHNGHKALKEKLERSGFKIVEIKIENVHNGYLQAERIEEN